LGELKGSYGEVKGELKGRMWAWPSFGAKIQILELIDAKNNMKNAI